MRITINNQSTVVDTADIYEVLPALRGQASELCKAWGLDRPTIGCQLRGSTVVIDILDDSDMQGALGYHDMVDGKPMARVFAKTDAQYGLDWRVTLSHELLELIVDATALAAIQIGTGTFAAMEVCDPVEADADGEPRGGFMLSNWIYPSWFDPQGKFPYDKMGLLKQPLSLRPGGYVSYWTPSGGWQQSFAQAVPGTTSRMDVGAHRSIIRREADKYGPLPEDPFSKA